MPWVTAGAADETLASRVRANRSDVRTFEPDYVARTGETAAAHPDLTQTTQSLDEALVVDRAVTDFYGTPAWNGYAHQPAFSVMGLDHAHEAGKDGAGITVAVIDSGVDPQSPLLQDVLLPGYDFTRNQPGASEWGDLDQSTAAILDSHKCEPYYPTTTAEDGTVTQSTAAILDSETITQLAASPPVPAAFGHGTMVAGLVHAVAPRARILPVKAFSADGTGRSSDRATTRSRSALRE